MEKRVVFPIGKQKEFILDSRNNLNYTWPEFAKSLKVKRKTLEKAYRYEYCTLPYHVFISICSLRNLRESELIKFYNVKIITYQNVIGRKVLGESRTKLSKINVTFKHKPKMFDTSNILLSKYDQIKKLRFPKRLIPELAEELGMHCGDGFLSATRFEYRLKGNKNEKEYYDKFIRRLYKDLFNLDLNIKEYETTYGFELSSKGFWNFKTKVLGIPSGRKNNLKLPEIIKTNDINILASFTRGLFDTDGCFRFAKKYSNLGHYYPDISLSLKSKYLVVEIAEILQMFGLEPKIARKKDYWMVYLNGVKRLELYLKLIGTHNPKNIDKIIKWKQEYPELGRNIMAVVI